MENTTEVEYISIYDKPKRARGRPSGSKYSDEEKRQKTWKQVPVAITIIMNITIQKRSYKQAKNEAIKDEV